MDYIEQCRHLLHLINYKYGLSRITLDNITKPVWGC